METKENLRQTTRLFKDEQGIYHWAYSLPMFKNFSILRTVMKGMCFAFLVVLCIPAYIIIRNGISIDDLGLVLGIPLLCIGIVAIIAVGCYFLVAWIYGGQYMSIYSMDEHKIGVYQPTDQADKNKVIAAFTTTAGVIDGNLGLVFGSIAMTGTQIVETNFSSIRSLKLFPELQEIRVHSFLTWYTIYVCPEDYELVAEFITSRSVNAKIARK